MVGDLPILLPFNYGLMSLDLHYGGRCFEVVYVLIA